LLLQSFGIPAIHGGQMCRHRSSTQVLDRWSKPTTASSAQRGEKAHGCAFSPACYRPAAMAKKKLLFIKPQRASDHEEPIA
jgi:hypothetical protein